MHARCTQPRAQLRRTCRAPALSHSPCATVSSRGVTLTRAQARKVEPPRPAHSRRARHLHAPHIARMRSHSPRRPRRRSQRTRPHHPTLRGEQPVGQLPTSRAPARERPRYLTVVRCLATARAVAAAAVAATASTIATALAGAAAPAREPPPTALAAPALAAAALFAAALATTTVTTTTPAAATLAAILADAAAAAATLPLVCACSELKTALN